MDATRTQGSGARAHRSLYFIAVALVIVLSIAVVSASTHRASDGERDVTTKVVPIAIPPTDPAALIHRRIQAAIARLDQQ